MKDVTGNKLIILRSVIRAGSLSKAAEQQKLTVSAVSQQVQSIEKAVGLPLLERHSRGVLPTEAGKLAATYGDEIFDSLISFHHAIEDLKNGELGTLVCGIFPTIATSLGPTILKGRSSVPGLNLNLRSARLAQLRNMLRQREVDVALTWTYPWDEYEKETFTQKAIMRDSTVFLVPEFDSRTRWEGLINAEIGWITRSNEHQINSVLQWTARQYGFEPRIVYRANDWAEVQGMVEAGLGIALAPELATVPLRPGVRVVPFPTAPVRTIFLTKRRGQPDHPGEDVLIERILDAEGSLFDH